MKAAGWGNYPVVDARQVDLRSFDASRLAQENRGTLISRGMGRSYGDSSLADIMVCTGRCKRILELDEDAGLVTCEAGLVLADLLDVIVPRGWFVPVTPGTRFVSIGGMVAADVHGKNHHVDGSFGMHIRSMSIMSGCGDVTRCSKHENSELFYATIGGMGLTGIILTVSFSLRRVNSAFVRQETIKAANLDDVMQLFSASTDWTYSVAWIDCLASGSKLGRSLLFRGEHAEPADLSGTTGNSGSILEIPKKRTLGVPVYLPGFALNRYSIKLFNSLYYSRARSRCENSVVDYETFFYPLDRVLGWNKLYGRRGFLQYQCVFPLDTSHAGVKELLEAISAEGRGSFLAVLKLFGPGNSSPLSFPLEGYTLALDFPVHKGVFGFLDRLDDIVARYGGRLYLAKDARMTSSMFGRGYPAVAEFRSIRANVDPDRFFESLQSKRLMENAAT